MSLDTYFLDERELATVLAALRHWQNALDHDAARDIMPDHFFDVSPLDEDEIDDLCERLNR